MSNGNPQFKLNQTTNTITLNQPLAQQTLFLGVLGGTGNDTFNLPIYPVFSIQNMYIALGGDLGTAPLNSFDFDSDDGTVSVTSTPGGLYTQGQPVYAVCNPAIAIQYELAAQTYATSHTYRLLDSRARAACSSGSSDTRPDLLGRDLGGWRARLLPGGFLQCPRRGQSHDGE